MTSRDLLTCIQLLASAYPQNNYEHLEEIRNKISEQEYMYLKKEYDSLPSDYQVPFFYKIIKEPFENLKRTVENFDIYYKKKHILPKPIPVFGTANYESFNAFVETDGHAYVIVFNEGLLKLVENLIEIYTRECWLIKNGKMNSYYQKIINKNFVDIMLCYHLYNSAFLARRMDFFNVEDFGDFIREGKIADFTPPFGYEFSGDDYILFNNQHKSSAYLWIAAHEYSHILLGHLEDSDSISKMNFGNTEFKRLLTGRQQELDADLLGALISLECQAYSFSLDSIYFVLIATWLSSKDHSFSIFSSHPETITRIKNIFCNEIIRSKQKSNYEQVHKIFDSKYQIFRNILSVITENDITFSSVKEMQRYVYNEADI